MSAARSQCRSTRPDGQRTSTSSRTAHMPQTKPDAWVPRRQVTTTPESLRHLAASPRVKRDSRPRSRRGSTCPLAAEP